MLCLHVPPLLQDFLVFLGALLESSCCRVMAAEILFEAVSRKSLYTAPSRGSRARREKSEKSDLQSASTIQKVAVQGIFPGLQPMGKSHAQCSRRFTACKLLEVSRILLTCLTCARAKS